jgi:hypothetical protein
MEAAVPEATQQILSQGLLGALLIISLSANVYLLRLYNACQEGRLADAKALQKVIDDNTKAMSASTISQENNNRLAEARTRATEAVASELRLFAERMGYLKESVDKMRQ